VFSTSIKLSYSTPDSIFENISLKLLLAFHLYFVASVIESLQSLRASKQGHGVMCARQRREKKGKKKNYKLLSLFPGQFINAHILEENFSYRAKNWKLAFMLFHHLRFR